MTLTIELSEAVNRRLTTLAQKAGKSVEVLASDLIEKAVPEGKEATLAEILAPFRQEFAESGMTDEEWDALIETARDEVWQEKQTRKQL